MLEMAVMHKHRGNVWFFFSVFLLCSGLKSSLFYIVFWMPTQSLWSHVLPTYIVFWMPTQSLWSHVLPTWTCLQSRMLPMQLLLRKYQHSVYFRKPVHILLCHPRDLCCISAGTFASCLHQIASGYPVMPPTQLIRLVEGIFWSISNNMYLSRKLVWIQGFSSFRLVA